MRSNLHSQQQQQEQQRSKFMPMLCSSSSSKEVKLSHRRCPSSSGSSSSVSVAEDPSSPRVGCMGQVKRNNKVVGFPSILSFTTSTSSGSFANILKNDHHPSSSSATTSNVVKYHKLRSFFSSRSLTNSPAATTRTGTLKGKSVRNRSTSVVNNNRGREIAGVDHHGSTSRRICRSVSDENKNTNNISDDQNGGGSVNLEELDPPLPVVKQVQKQEGGDVEKMNLWTRRSGGAPLKSLQLQVQSINQSHTLLSANTV